VVSLGGERLAVLVEDEAEGWTHLAVLEGKRLVFLLGPGDLGGEDVVRPSPRGSYFAILDPGAAGVRVFDRDGGPLRIPEVTNPHAIAWSPDERWTALATAWGIHVYRTDDPDGLVVRIPLRVRDLDWDFDPADSGKRWLKGGSPCLRPTSSRSCGRSSATR
jgi:hypothetical protein